MGSLHQILIVLMTFGAVFAGSVQSARLGGGLLAMLWVRRGLTETAAEEGFQRQLLQRCPLIQDLDKDLVEGSFDAPCPMVLIAGSSGKTRRCLPSVFLSQSAILSQMQRSLYRQGSQSGSMWGSSTARDQPRDLTVKDVAADGLEGRGVHAPRWYRAVFSCPSLTQRMGFGFLGARMEFRFKG